MHHAIIFFSLIVTIFSQLDPNERYAICRLDGINAFIDCANPCGSANIITCNAGQIELIQFSGLNKSAPIPTEYGYFSKLRTLDLKGNSLTGTIPTQLGNLTSLDNLYLNNNKLTGTIPKDLGNLMSLNILHLSNNELSGPIPGEFGNIAYLQYLYLNNNNITGTIPSQLGVLTHLDILFLNNNTLSGSIPEEFGNMTHLQELNLNNNNLTGIIPTQLGKLTNLTRLDLSNNQLTGTVPTQILNLVNNNGLQLFYSNNNINPPTQPIYPQPNNSTPPIMNLPQPIYPNPQQDNTSLEVIQSLNLSDGNFVYQTVNISSGSLLITKNTNLTTTTINLSENSILSITNSSIHVQDNITIPTGFILSIINPTTTSLETSGYIIIQPNTTINISLPPNYGDTQSNDLTLISFKHITGTFSKVNVNNECIELVENNIGFVLIQSSERKCTSSSTQETITICAIVTIFFISLLF